MIQVIPKALCNARYGGIQTLIGEVLYSTQYSGIADGLGSLTTGTPSSGAIPVGHPLPVAGTFRNLVVYSRDTSRAGDIVVTVKKNGSDTALTTTLAGGSTTAPIITDDVACVAGDRVYYEVFGASTGAFGFDVAVCLEFEATRSIYGLMSFGGSVGDGDGHIGGAFGNGVFQDYGGSGVSNTYSICALEGVVDRLDLYAHSGAPGAGVWTGYMVVDGIVQDGTGGTVDTTCILTGGDVHAFSTFSLPTELGKKYDVLVVRSGEFASFNESHVSAGVSHLPDTAGAYMVCGGSNDTTSASETAWKWTRSEQIPGPETRHLAPVGPRGFAALGLYIRRGTSPGGAGSGRGYVHTLRRNQVNTGLVVTIEDEETEGVLLETVPFLPNGVISLQAEPYGPSNPASSQFHWGLALRPLTVEDVDAEAVIGPLVWVEFPRLVDEDALAADPDDPPTPDLPTPPSPAPDPPPAPPIPPVSPPPDIEGDYGPIVEMAPAYDVEILAGADIQDAIDANPAGTIYYLRAGYYRQQTITPKDGDEIWGEFGAVLTGAEVLTNWFFDGVRYYTIGQTQQGSTGGVCLAGSPRCNRPEDVFFNGTALRHVSSLLNLVSGTFYFDYGADRIYIKDNPVGQIVETSITEQAIIGTATNVVLRNIVVEKYACRAQVAAITPGGAGWTYKQIECRHNHGIGARIFDGLTAHRSRFHHNGQLGIGGTGDGVLVYENEIAYNNYAGHSWEWEAGGTKFTSSDGLTVQSNWVHHNTGPGLWTDIDNINVIHEGNLVEDNTAYGIIHEISYDALIRFNTVRRNGGASWTTSGGNAYRTWHGILVSASPNVEVYGNTLNDNAGGILAMQQNRGSGAHGLYETENLNVHDNVVIQPAGPVAGLIQDVGDTTYFTGRGNVFEDNEYQTGACGLPRWAWQDGLRTFAQWQAYGHDDTGSCA